MFKLVIDSNTKGVDIRCLEDKKVEEKLIEILAKDESAREKLKTILEKSNSREPVI